MEEQPAQLRRRRLWRVRLHLTTQWMREPLPGVMHWALLQTHAAAKLSTVGPQVVLPIRAARLLEYSRLLGGHAGIKDESAGPPADQMLQRLRKGGRAFVVLSCF